MSEGQRLVKSGTSGATAVYTDHKTVGTGDPVKVTLTANYTMEHPPGYPSRPSFTGAAIPQFPHTLLFGAVVILHAEEAVALKAAGGAT